MPIDGSFEHSDPFEGSEAMPNSVVATLLVLLGSCDGYEDCGRLLLNWLGRRHREGSRLAGALPFLAPLLSAGFGELHRRVPYCSCS